MPLRRGRRSDAGRAVVSGRATRARDTAAVGGGSGAVELLWLDVLQRITSRAAHEVKGALNGASVNLEVVRSRSDATEMVAGEAIRRYATAAATQLEIVITMADALLALARAPREAGSQGLTSHGEEPALLLRRLVSLIAPTLRIDDHSLTVCEPLEGLDTSAAPPLAVRAVIGAALIEATVRWPHTLCRVHAEQNRLVIESESAAPGSVATLAREMLDAAADAGIQVQMDGSAISMTFPRDNGGRTTGMAS